MARVTLGTGESITVGGNTEIFGTSGAQNVTIIDGSTVTFRSGFNSGGDTIRLNGNASDFSVSFSGSNVTLTSVTDGITVVIPIGVVANTIVFDNGDSRSLSLVNGVPTLGGQAITGTPTALPAGPGVYEVTSSGEVLEGGVLTFTVTRTDTSTAETLQATALGFTNGGTIVDAQQGDDFTVAGATLTFAVGQATRTFTISAPLDAEVEGVEGLRVNIVKGGSQVVATTTALILDGTPEGQTFQLTTGLDTVGTGVPTDLIGSGGNAGTGGNDTIVAVTGEVSLLNPNLGLTGTLTPFDNINGGAGTDTLLVLDNGNPFTSAPNFTGVTVDNVESLDYRAPTRGFLGGAFNVNTAGFDGLENATFFINGSTTQTITLDDETTSTAANGVTPTDVNTSATVTQIGDGDLVINGGGDSLNVTAADGNVFVGGANQNGGLAPTGTAASNSYDTVAITGGRNVTVTDRGAQELATVSVTGTGNNVSVRGAAVTAVNVSNLADTGFRDIDVDVNAAATLTLTGINDADDFGSQLFDINSQGNIRVVTDSSVNGLADLISKGTRVDLVSNGDLALSDINVLGTNATVSIEANGDVGLDNIDGGAENGVPEVFGNSAGSTANDVRNVILSGTGSVTMTSVQQAGNTNDTKTTITSTNVPGGITIFDQLGNDTLFNGSANTGNDNITFGATTEDNSFGGGTDRVTFNSDTFGTTGGTGTSGSFDGGESVGDDDRLVMESNDAATFTSTAQAVVNFEHLELDFQDVAKHDVINLANIGLNDISNVTSDIGAGSEPEISRVLFSGETTGADSVTITAAGLNVTVPLTDDLGDGIPNNGDDAAAIAAKVAAAIDGVNGYSAVVDPDNSEAVIITGPTGVDANVAVSFTDGTDIGAPGREQILGILNNDGRAPAAEDPDTALLELTSVTILNGETITIQYDNVDGTDGEFTFTNTTGQALTQEGGTLADLIVAAANADGDFNDNAVAVRVGNNVRFTALAGETDGDTAFIFNGSNTGLTTGLDVFTLTNEKGSAAITGLDEDAVFVLDGEASADDTLEITLRDNDPLTADEVITVQFEDGDTNLTGLRNAVINAINAQSSLYTANVFAGAEFGFAGVPFIGIGVQIQSINNENLPDLTAADFRFIDDSNVGTPGAAVTVLQQGTTSSVTLNNFISGSTLTLTNTNGNHTVNMKTDTTADVLNLVLAVDAGDHGVVTAKDAETVNIDTTGSLGTDTLDLFGGDLTTLVIEGANGLTLDTNSTKISSIDATGLGGLFTWSADANTVAITVRTGAGDSDVDFSAMTIPGGNASAGTAPITFIGGSGDDVVTTGNLGTSRGTITTGDGNDVVFVGIVDGGNDFWSIKDFDEKDGVSDLEFDVLDFAAAPVFIGRDQELEPTAIFQDYLDQAARGNTVDGNFTAGGIRYFWYDEDGDGDFDATYVVQDNSDSEDFVDGSDTVIRLEGQITLTADNFI
ncbi:hypothetical protein GVM20_00655 [Porphyrobacter sp. SLTP]|uniref:beta strand repeat-containing protein n=1 Tax=Porphyrobacter sp. SLTP TaxID=2683266 RepID=UPI001413405A|nr:hypothetical protein [Porphyrobacter sp. SLTP]NBB23633.1 hypothetical protein [Porphyrobacter sp. SLTP]